MVENRNTVKDNVQAQDTKSHISINTIYCSLLYYSDSKWEVKRVPVTCVLLDAKQVWNLTCYLLMST